MKAWLQRNWKTLLALAAGVVLVVVLYLRSRSSSSGASTISFPGNPVAGTDAGTTPTPSDVTQAVQQFLGTIRSPGGAPTYDPGRKGIPLWSGIGIGNVLELVPWGAQVQILDSAQGPPNPISGETTYYKVNWGGIIGWISSFDLASFLGSPPAGFGSPPSSGSTSLPAPVSAPNPAAGSTATPTASLGLGGPGTVYPRLQSAALAAEGAAHRAALVDPRRAGRLARQARQAAAEGRRIFQESRGAAPIGGPGRFLNSTAGRWRQR